MHHPDLSPLAEDVLAVGWLGHELPTGELPAGFPEKLLRLCEEPIRLTRGSHECPFCEGPPARGNGEIHLRGPGCVFVAPKLVGHYVAAHGYRPPDVFIDTVQATTWARPGLLDTELAKSIRRLGEAPTYRDEKVFHQALLRGRVAVALPGGPRSALENPRITSVEEAMALGWSWDGPYWPQVEANLAWLRERMPRWIYADLAGREVLETMRDRGLGLRVHVPGPRPMATGELLPGEVRAILS
ncbi:MAG: hypothetical protein AAF533_14410 [Acidobacteriota bacterium]